MGRFNLVSRPAGLFKASQRGFMAVSPPDLPEDDGPGYGISLQRVD